MSNTIPLTHLKSWLSLMPARVDRRADRSSTWARHPYITMNRLSLVSWFLNHNYLYYIGFIINWFGGDQALSCCPRPTRFAWPSRFWASDFFPCGSSCCFVWSLIIVLNYISQAFTLAAKVRRLAINRYLIPHSLAYIEFSRYPFLIGSSRANLGCGPWLGWGYGLSWPWPVASTCWLSWGGLCRGYSCVGRRRCSALAEQSCCYLNIMFDTPSESYIYIWWLDFLYRHSVKRLIQYACKEPWSRCGQAEALCPRGSSCPAVLRRTGSTRTCCRSSRGTRKR